MKKVLFLTLGAMVALSSCNENEADVIVPVTKGEVSFTTGDIQSRVSGSQFEAGDAITVEAYSDGALVKSQNHSYNNSVFTASAPFELVDGESMSYTATYPINVTKGTFADDFSFAIAADQSEASAYEASDLLVANTDATSATQPSLSFYHTMSVINVTLKGVAADQNYSVELKAMNNVTANISKGTYVGTGSVASLTPLATTDGFCVVVAPQTLASAELATITIDGISYSWELKAESELLSGYRYNYEWTIDQVIGTSEVSFTGLINDWTDGEWGTAGSTNPDTDNSYVFDYEALGTAWLNDTDKTLNGIDWHIDGMKNSGTYGNIGFSYFNEVGGSCYNKTAFGTGVTEIIVDLKSGEPLTVYAGASENPTNEVAPTNAGNIYTYTVPASCPYVALKNNSTGYINLNSLVINY